MSRTTTLKAFINEHCSVPKPFYSQGYEIHTWSSAVGWWRGGKGRHESSPAHSPQYSWDRKAMEMNTTSVQDREGASRRVLEALVECQSTVVVPGNSNMETFSGILFP